MTVAQQSDCELVGFVLFRICWPVHFPFYRICDGIHTLIDQGTGTSYVSQAHMCQFVSENEQLPGILVGLIPQHDYRVTVDLQRHAGDALASAGKVF
ncbi:hypothetical protein HEP75_00054 [Xanthomonas sp. SI]|nr:hypothetical protein HEP75_00054 [Xanthomonas sp. SI]